MLSATGKTGPLGESPPDLIRVGRFSRIVSDQNSHNTNMSEEVIYSDNTVSVSTSRIVIGGTTYALRNITSVKMTFAPAKTGCAIALIVLGALIFVVGLAQGGQTVIGSLLGGAIIGGLGFLWFRSCKTDYFVAIASSSGEVRALTSKDKSYVEKIVAAINDAIIQYR
jgi:hypothetical protein